MKTIIFALFLSLQTFADSDYKGSQFSSVWQQVISDVYTELPQERVSLVKFFDFGTDLLSRAAVRTVNNKNDILPRFNKLLHPNGICLKGTWKITKDNNYSGYFKKGSEALIISRASVALSETTKGHYRGFGMTGKLFATNDAFDKNFYKTANFFTVDDLSGSLANSFLETEMTNQPKISLRIGSILTADIAAAASLALSKADANPLKRQVYEVAALGLNSGEEITVPSLMKLSGTAGQRLNGLSDFREEILEQISKEGFIQFDISVADGSDNFKKIGIIKYTEAVVSESCDHRLHFHHPKFISKLEASKF